MQKNNCQSNIKCSVKSCEYHDVHDLCSANQITVGEPDAITSKETKCDTFKVKGSYTS